MKLYCTPGGTWAGNEKDWKAALKAEGIDHKTVTQKVVEVPTSKPELLEFLTFYNVNCVSPGQTGEPPAPQAPPSPQPVASPAPTGVSASDLDQLFAAAPIGQQLRLAVAAIDHADVRIKNGS
jgi:hypothetical protein